MKKAILLKSSIVVVSLAVAVVLCLLVVEHLNEGRQVPVLMYHGIVQCPGDDVWAVSASEFESQMRNMKTDGRVAILPRHLWLASKSLYLLPRKPVLVTFDDGFRNNVDIAEPIMGKYGMKGICYLIMSHIADSGEMRSQYRGHDNLVWPEVRSAMERGILSFGVHSITHTPSRSRQATEVTPARYDFKVKTGKKADAYCYPFGGVNEKLLAAVKYKNRYKTAMVCKDQVLVFSRKTDLYQIPRVSIYGGTHEFALKTAVVGNGSFSAVVSNLGNELPFKVVLRDNATGSIFDADKPCVRLGNGKTEMVKWNGVPCNDDASRLEVLIQEQNGLFTYTNLPFAGKIGQWTSPQIGTP